MNIFWLDNDPVLAAQYQCDKHVVKMILESAQLLCTAHHVIGLTGTHLPNKFYKKTHVNHPCSKWVRSHHANYDWLAIHAVALFQEYTYRYDKVHKSQPIIEWCFNNYPPIRLYHFINDLVYEANIYNADGHWVTPPAQAMPVEYQIYDQEPFYNGASDPVKAYRDYYWYDKRVNINMRWTRRGEPDWWTQRLNELAMTE